jgi:hypothetical protein
MEKYKNIPNHQPAIAWQKPTKNQIKRALCLSLCRRTAISCCRLQIHELLMRKAEVK